MGTPTVYIMKLSNEPVVRIGHHTRSNEARERECNRNLEGDWSIEHHLQFDTKLEAAAVEALTHAALQECFAWRPRINNGRRQLVFRCSVKRARQALDAAERAVKTHLSGAG